MPVKGGYPLRAARLGEGRNTRQLISFDHGYWTVQAEGRTFKVFLTQVESGWLYELNGRWLEADDPRVIAMKEQSSRDQLLISPFFMEVQTPGKSPVLLV